MGNRAVITKQEVLEAAYAIAATEGLGALSVRAVARACGVAVGTIYNSYPTKSDLVNDVVAFFWREAFSGVMQPEAERGDDFIAFCRRLEGELGSALERFRSDFLADLAVMDAYDLAAARRREEESFAHARAGLASVLERDPSIDHARLVGPLAPELLCDLVWQTLLDSARFKRPFDETLIALLVAALRHSHDAKEA